ncbi:MAG: hypothetical protein NTV54_16325 [Ignavibacteriales bacterium]|nr:hypothetical protein [Ignavibacteriales bacterium]
MTGLPDESLRCARAAFVLAARQTGHREEPNEMQLWLLRHLLDLVKHTVCGRPKPGALGKSIQSLLLTLDPVYREVIVLRHCLGLNLHAIGEILSLPERKVKSRLSIARQMLHDHSTARKDS